VGGRAHRALIAAALVAVSPSAVAQNPPPAPVRDSAIPQLIYNEVFAPGALLPGFVTLSDGVVYRVEVQPARAVVSFRVRTHATLPPLLMVPLSGEAAGGETASYLIVPRASDEYRVDVTALGDEPVRVRIWIDPKESSRFARIRTEGFRVPTIALAVRAVYLATFRDAFSSSQDAAFGFHTAPESAVGIEGCLAVLPNGRILPDRVGGCAITFAQWSRPSGRTFYTVGIAPELVVRRTGATALSLSPHLAFGSTNGGRPTAQYVLIGLGGRYTAPFAFSPAVGYQLEATVVDIRSLPAALDTRRVSALTLRLAAGLMLKL
jgi:hypothetical protein